MSPRVSHARHTSSVLKFLKNQSDKIISKVKLNPLQESRGGRNIIRSNYNSKARGTSRSYHLKNTRERDQTHSYWYIPSAPRENYSLLVMESTGMMKMATREGFPLREGAETGLDWLLVATEASGGGPPDLFCPPKFLGYMDIYGRKKYAGGPLGCPRGRGACPRGAPS